MFKFIHRSVTQFALSVSLDLIESKLFFGYQFSYFMKMFIKYTFMIISWLYIK